MAKATCKFEKKAMMAGKTPAKAAKGDPLSTDFSIIDNGDQTFTVLGTTIAGNKVDISGVAKLDAVSDDTSVVTLDVPLPMVFGVHVPVPAPVIGAVAKCHVTATWGDGSVGPYTFDFTETIVAGPISGVVPVPGPVTTH